MAGCLPGNLPERLNDCRWHRSCLKDSAIETPCMKKILLAAALIGTVTAVAIVCMQYLAEDDHIEDPTMDIWE